MEDLPSHVISVEERRVERLAWRTEFLSRRSARVEEAWALAQTLIDALKQEVSHQQSSVEHSKVNWALIDIYFRVTGASRLHRIGR
jgi:hypothetical protein